MREAIIQPAQEDRSSLAGQRLEGALDPTGSLEAWKDR